MVVLQGSFLATKIFSMMEGSLNVLNLLNAPVTSPSAGILREAPKGPSLKMSNTGLSLLVLAAQSGNANKEENICSFGYILSNSTLLNRKVSLFFFFQSQQAVLPNFVPAMSSLALVCSPLPKHSAAAEGASGFGKQKGVSCTCRCLPSYRISSWERCIFYTKRKSRLNKTSICLQLLSQVRRLPAAIFSSPLQVFFFCVIHT